MTETASTTCTSSDDSVFEHLQPRRLRKQSQWKCRVDPRVIISTEAWHGMSTDESSTADVHDHFGQTLVDEAESQWQSEWYVEEDVLHVKQLRGARRTLKSLRKYCRPKRVAPGLLKAPALDMLSKFNEEEGADQEAVAHKSITRSTLPSATKQPNVRPFVKLQDAFWEHHKNTLSYTFGPNAVLSKTCLSGGLENQFMRRLRACAGAWENSVCLAFHGTKTKNFSSIFRKGFLLPGTHPGRVPIANGNAHGPGIYTAKEGCADLSHGFCDSKSMLVCGVIDHDKYGDIDKVTDNSVRLLRIGRFPKQPSGPTRIPPIAPTSGPPNRMLGNYMVSRETREVRHVGDAMVVFNPGCVVPLLKVDQVPTRLYQPDWMPKAEHDHEQVNKQIDHAYWPSGGNPNLTVKVDVASMMTVCSPHAVMIKRHAACKQRHQDHQRASRWKL